MILKADVDNTGKVTRKMFLEVMHRMHNEASQYPPAWMTLWYTLVYAEVYSCSPKKLFIPLICAVQIFFWIAQTYESEY